MIKMPMHPDGHFYSVVGEGNPGFKPLNKIDGISAPTYCYSILFPLFAKNIGLKKTQPKIS